MEKRILGARLPLSVSTFLLGIFLLLAIFLHSDLATAQMGVSCDQLQKECFSTCNSSFNRNANVEAGYKNFGCLLGCAWYRDLFVKHLGEIIMPSSQVGVSCNQLQDVCFSTCHSNFDRNVPIEGECKDFGCTMGCGWYRELCMKNIGKIITALFQEEMFLAEAPLRLFEKMVDKEHP